jgi:hypothetical protein
LLSGDNNPGSLGLAQLLAEKIYSDHRSDKNRDYHRRAANILTRKSKIIKCYVSQCNRDVCRHADCVNNRKYVEAAFHNADRITEMGSSHCEQVHTAPLNGL